MAEHHRCYCADLHHGSDFKGHLPNMKGFVYTQGAIISYRDMYLEG